ncbi:MAG: DUF4097 family beta strand repeat protein [Bacteroidales bacterium]|nr:MAG: DUF4097 family beta strand repeat protein [Bacteroidales bacterium]
MIRTTLLIMFLCGVSFYTGVKEEHKEKISETLVFDGTSDQNILLIRNIHGSIDITGYQGNQVSLEIEKVIEAENQQDLEEGIRDISLGIINTGDSIILYTDSPYATLNRKNGKISYQWNYDNNGIDYHFVFDYTVKVPYGTMLNVSTVNEGDVTILDTKANVRAGNVNGSVYLEKILAVTSASTVNGDVECEIMQKPVDDCSFHTINGDIKITLPADLSADISYQTMHGDFYTDFDFDLLPGQVETTKEKSGSGTTYKIEKNPTFRVGEGDIKMLFKTINGNMILKMAK